MSAAGLSELDAFRLQELLRLGRAASAYFFSSVAGAGLASSLAAGTDSLEAAG